MDSNFSSVPNKRESENNDSGNYSVLILHNDDFNSFEFVMKTLEEVCNHSSTQAEQCAVLTHYKGKCEIMSGALEKMRPISKTLISRGLTVTIVQ
ncbi:ATP-dependent Clp protease adaptor ClpS [Bacteroidota bacterium]